MQKTLFLAHPRGWCAGVVRAVHTVERALELWGSPIYVKHAIVHNRHVVKSLEDKGAIFIEDLAEVPEGERIIYSAHGIPPSVREHAKRRNLFEIDATCGLVTRIHSAVKRFAAKGYQIVLIGHRKHVEIIGIYGEAPEHITVVQNIEEAEQLSFPPGTPLMYTTQTTLSLDDLADIVEVLKRRYPDIVTLPSDSVCYATSHRQRAIRALLHQVQLVLVVGDPTSSNSNRLREIAERRGVNSFLINAPEEINPDWLEGVEGIGLTAGASSPNELIEDCIGHLMALGVTNLEDVVYVKEDVLFQLPKEVLVKESKDS